MIPFFKSSSPYDHLAFGMRRRLDSSRADMRVLVTFSAQLTPPSKFLKATTKLFHIEMFDTFTGPTHRRTKSPYGVDGLWNKQQILPPQMTTKMKGLLKGLRYISQIFETEEKEQEMQIGFPTDVKHVAHIGWDGPSVNPPSWMNEYRTTPDFSSAPLSSVGEGKDLPWPASAGGNAESAAKDLRDLPKPSRRHCSSSTSPSRDVSEGSRPSRRYANGEHSDMPRHPRRRHGSGAGSGGAGDSPTKDAVSGSQHSRRRKSKGSGGGSTRSGRSKANGSTLSDPDMIKNGESSPALTAIAEGEGN